MQHSIKVKTPFTRKVHRLPSRRNTLSYLSLTFALVAVFFLCIGCSATVTPPVPAARSTAGKTTTYYVSKSGNNADGKSWATAWNELANIKWSVVQPGDTILLDGGSQSMVYTTTLTVGKSGTRTAPIIIERSTDVGHNGHVVLFGGGSPLPYCGQTQYVYQKPQRQHGIDFSSNSWIVLDGMSWDGISVYGYISDGVEMTGGPRNDTLRHMEIYENGAAVQSGGTWSPDSGVHGVYLTGSNLTFEYMNIYDNADDEFDTGESPGINNVTINYSWMHVTRDSPLAQGLPFNDCTHQDGYQIYNGGVQNHLLIENSVVGPGLGENFILGQSPNSANDNAIVNSVTIRNVLTIGKERNILGYPQVQETGWVVDHVTAITPGEGIPANNSEGVYQAFFLQGKGNTVTNSIFYDGMIYEPDGLVDPVNNCQWNTTGDTSVLGGKTVDPEFVTDISSYNFSTPTATIANANYALQSTSPCKGLGSSITSVNSFLQLVRSTT